MRQPGSITMVEIQRLVGQQAIGLESLRLYVEELEALQPKPEIVDMPVNGREPAEAGVADG
jgi:hypothetical protein